MGKKWYQSKSVWFGLAKILVGAATASISLVMNEGAVVTAGGSILSALGMIDVGLRAVTNDPIVK